MHGLVIDDPKLSFSSSHFIAEHDKCERLHGHNYRVKIELIGELGDDHMVQDFKEVKDTIKSLCDRLDHKILLPTQSPSLEIQDNGSQIDVQSLGKSYSFPKGDCEFLPIEASTAESLAKMVFMELKKDLPLLSRVFISESEGSIAFYSED
jgi:6-pyruvoyltetrahydropterin/6-carboxytetrahydropterin synthase